MKFLRGLSLLVVLHASPAWGAGFEPSTLSVPGGLRWVADGDVDGDGAVDLVVSYRRGGGSRAQRFLAVFFRRDDGFGSRPDLAFRAVATAAAFDLGDVDGRPGLEVLSWSEDGVYAQTLRARRVSQPYRIVEQATLVGQPEDDDLVHWDFMRRFGENGEPTIILPGPGQLYLYRKRGPLWKLWAKPKVAPQQFYEAESDNFRPSDDGGGFGTYAFRILTLVPKLAIVDQTGDRRPDLVASFEDRVAVYPALSDGGLAERPVYAHDFGLRTPSEIESGEAYVQSQVVDLDGDGIADLALRKNAGGIRDAQSSIQLFLGRRGGGFEAQPSQRIERKGVAAVVGFEDVDGDGQVELLVPRLEISLFSIIGVFTSGKLSIDVDIYPRRRGSDAIFDDRPRQTITVRIGVDFGDGGTVQGSTPILGHDFDGDGRRDVILSDGGERMRLHRGLKAGSDGYFQRTGFIELVGPGSPTTRALATGAPDALPDVLVTYVSRKDLTGRMMVFRNQHDPPSAQP
jgi:hypothetical protein